MRYKKLLEEAVAQYITYRHTNIYRIKSGKLRAILAPHDDYEKKVKYVEDNIEDDITYFNTGFGAAALEMANIKSKMRALEKRLLEKNSSR